LGCRSDCPSQSCGELWITPERCQAFRAAAGGSASIVTQRAQSVIEQVGHTLARRASSGTYHADHGALSTGKRRRLRDALYRCGRSSQIGHCLGNPAATSQNFSFSRQSRRRADGSAGQEDFQPRGPDRS
jgi:hypothetical protein